MKKYFVVTAGGDYKLIDSLGHLERAVTNKLSEGWELYGNPFVVGTMACQAMTLTLETLNSRREK